MVPRSKSYEDMSQVLAGENVLASTVKIHAKVLIRVPSPTQTHRHTDTQTDTQTSGARL